MDNNYVIIWSTASNDGDTTLYRSVGEMMSGVFGIYKNKEDALENLELCKAFFLDDVVSMTDDYDMLYTSVNGSIENGYFCISHECCDFSHKVFINLVRTVEEGGN